MSKNKLILSFCLIFNTIYISANEKIENQNLFSENNILKTHEDTFQNKVSIELKEFLDTKAKTLLISKRVLKSYYEENDYKAFWFDKNGIKDISLTLLETIKNDPVLKPHSIKAFKLDTIISQLNKLDTRPQKYISSMIQIDFMFTEIYDKYMRYLSKGTINWERFTSELKLLDKKKEIIADWEKYDTNINAQLLLKEAINKNSLKIAFNEADSTYPKTKELIKAMNELEKIASKGGYTTVPSKEVLKLGEKSQSIVLLRKRLLQSKDLTKNCSQEISASNIITNNIQLNSSNPNIQEKEEINCEEVFDEDLQNAVISFQKSHGLTADGVVGLGTLKVLNLSVENKIDLIRLNLERMRWLPRNLGEKYLIVNIPDYNLKMYDKNKIKLDMPVVVGERNHPTPIFSNAMSYITLNPYWRIPNRIAQKELLPKIVKNPNYANEKGIRVHEQWDPNSTQVNTNNVDWAEYLTYLKNLEAQKKNGFSEPIIASEEVLSLSNLRFIQVPSDANPLGRIKFMFPNKYSVYMHDTPEKSLFNRTTRAFSHGCIRLSKPRELLKILSQYDTNINYEKATEILKNIDKKDIGLKEKIPVHIVYLTSWIDENGKLQFRNDIYNYDVMQKKYLF